MAHSAKLLSFILLISLSSSQIHARESHFFSKVSHHNNVQDTKNGIKDAQLPLPTEEVPLNKQYPEPKHTLTSQNENSYGLKTSQTTNYAPYITTSNGGRIYDLNNDPLLKNQEKYESYKGLNGYHPDEKYETMAYDTNNLNQLPNFYYNGGNMYDSNEDFISTRLADNGANKYSNVQKQGLSDTRFLENGRYYYDVSKDKYNFPNAYENYVETSSRYGYNKKN